MAPEQLGQVLGILAIILGATGDEGLSELLQGDRVDGIESNPMVSLQEQDQAGSRLFEAEADTGLGMLLAQLCEPIVQRFRGSADGLFAAFGRGGVQEIKIGLT